MQMKSLLYLIWVSKSGNWSLTQLLFFTLHQRSSRSKKSSLARNNRLLGWIWIQTQSPFGRILKSTLLTASSMKWSERLLKSMSILLSSCWRPLQTQRRKTSVMFQNTINSKYLTSTWTRKLPKNPWLSLNTRSILTLLLSVKRTQSDLSSMKKEKKEKMKKSIF